MRSSEPTKTVFAAMRGEVPITLLARKVHCAAPFVTLKARKRPSPLLKMTRLSLTAGECATFAPILMNRRRRQHGFVAIIFPQFFAAHGFETINLAVVGGRNQNALRQGRRG